MSGFFWSLFYFSLNFATLFQGDGYKVAQEGLINRFEGIRVLGNELSLPSKNVSVAQLVEQLTLNQRVRSSSLRGDTENQALRR